MSNEIRFTRIANSQKLSDRYLTVQVKEPSDPEKIPMGRIFALVEINNPWFPNSQIGQAIINTLTQEYYRSVLENPADNFEAAVKKVNETLGQIAQKGEIDWIGNINSILALIKDDKLYLTSSGKAEAILYRQEKVNKITQDSGQDQEPHPLKTYSNMISGELTKNDKILFTSPLMFDHLSLKELSDIITNNTSFEGAEEIAQFLKKEKAKCINAVIIEAVAKTDMENQTLQNEEVVYLDQTSTFKSMLNSSRKYTDQFSPVLSNIGKGLGTAWEKTKYFFNKEIAPRTKTTWEKTKELSSRGYKHLTTKTAPQIQQAIKPLSAKIADKFQSLKPKQSPTVTLEEPKPYSVHYYEEGGKKKKLSLLWMNKTLDNTKNVFSWLFDKNNRSVLYIAIALILVIILIVNIGQLRKKQNSKNKEQEQAQLLESMESKFEEAKLAILYNDQTKAKNLLDEVIKSALTVMSEQPKLSDQAKEIINKANVEFDKLTLTTRLNKPAAVGEFTKATKIFRLADNIVALNNENSKIYFIQPNQTNVSEREIGLDAGEKLTAFGFDNKDSEIYALSSKNQLYKINNLENSPEKITPAQGSWETTTDIAYFVENLYLLDAQSGQIFKHTGSANGYSSGVNYLDTSKVDLKNALSMTIDGTVFVLKNDNSVVKLSKSSPVEFNLRDIPLPNDKISKAKKIWTNSEISSLYILDDNRIIEFDKTGKFIHQYAFSPDLQNISDFIISPQEKKIWVLNNNKVYTAEY